MAKTYVLKNKNVEVLSFDVKTIATIYKTEMGISNIKILNENLLPRNFALQPNLEKSIFNWIDKRKVPKNREFANKILASISTDTVDYDDTIELIKKTLLLSLNDSYWLAPKGLNLSWEEYNLYTNPINETLALVAFTGHSVKIDGRSPSPEFTTNGLLKKCWRKNKNSGKIELVKGQITDAAIDFYGREAYSEYYMCQIAEILGFNHIKYNLETYHNQTVSICELFTSEDIGFISMGSCNPNLVDYNISEKIDKIIEIYGKEPFEDLMLFDALICNTDRHTGNFGMLIDNNSGKLLRPAPIFDNGYSFLNLTEEDYFDDIKSSLKINGHFKSAFEIDFDKQAKIFVRTRHISSLKKLQNFKFKRHDSLNLDEEILTKSENFISERSNMILNYALELQAKLNQSQNFSNAYTPNDDDDYYKPSSGMKM